MLKKIISITLIFLLFVSGISANICSAKEQSQARRIAYAPGEVIVKFQPGIIQMPAYLNKTDVKFLIVNSVSIKNLNEKYSLISMQRLSGSRNDTRFEDVYILKFQENVDVMKVAKDYSQDQSVIFARPNYLIFYYAAVSKSSYLL